MVDQDEQTTSDEAESALQTIDSVTATAQRYSAQPRWFIAVTAVVIFIVFTGIEPDGPNGLVPLIVLGIVRVYMERTNGLLPLMSVGNQWKTVAYVLLTVCFYLAIVYLYRIQQLSWAPLVGGTVTAVIYAIKAEHTRSKYLSTNSEIQHEE